MARLADFMGFGRSRHSLANRRLVYAVVIASTAGAITVFAAAAGGNVGAANGPSTAGHATEERSQSPRGGLGRLHVIRPMGSPQGTLRYNVAHLKRLRLVSAWVEYRGERRWLSVRMVSGAARGGVLRLRRPKGWRPRRSLLLARTPSKAGVHGCGFGRFRAGVWPGGCWRPYSDASPFNQPLPAKPRVATDSDRVVARLLGFGRIQDVTAGYADTDEDYGHPTYYSQQRDPRYRLHCYEASWGTCPIEGRLIKVPGAARPAGGGDAHLTVVDQDVGWEYDLYKVRSKPASGGLLDFRWGGRTRIDGDGLRSEATAAKFGNLAGIVRARELAAGRINHALFLIVYCDAGRAVYPAYGRGRSCSSVGLPTNEAPPMGARFQLAMTPKEINALRAPRWKKTILRAMATYGLFVGDTGSGSWAIKTESGSTFTSFGARDPLVAFGKANGWKAWGGTLIGNLRDGVDWTRLRLIDPCVTRRTC